MKQKTVKNFLSRNLIILSFVSFFTDIASEMLYPIMPLYLSDIGYGIVLIGLIEGLVLLMAGVIKILSGVYSDHIHKRKGLVTLGYGISAIAKPLMGLFSTYWAIFGFRLLDRFGKGVRNAPRDALLVEVSTPENRGKVFGFHRAADTFGATLGPLISLIILYFNRDNIGLIILLTAIPGAAAVISSLFIKEGKRKLQRVKKGGGIIQLYIKLKKYYVTATLQYKRVLYLIIIITLLKSTDIYLLLRARELGLSNFLIITFYILYNLTGTLIIYYLGSLSDRIGYTKTFAIGLLTLAGTYMLLSQDQLPLLLILLVFILYGVFQSVYEGLTSPWISLHLDKDDRATGLGVMMALQAIAMFLGTVVVGFTWSVLGAKIVFAIMGLASVGLSVFLFKQKQIS